MFSVDFYFLMLSTSIRLWEFSWLSWSSLDSLNVYGCDSSLGFSIKADRVSLSGSLDYLIT